MARRGKSLILLFSVFIAAILISGIFIPSSTGVYLKEVCPHNQTIVYDTVGNYSDFIILSNSASSSLDLKGYSLSDDPDYLRKYDLPEIELPPGGTLTVWASSPNFYDEYLLKETDLYTGFSLHDGESILLTDPAGVVTDKLTLSETTADQYFVRSSDLREWKIASYQSPDRPVSSDKVSPPSFSSPSGFYDTAFLLEISSSDRVLYTADGSDPRVKGTLYSAPFAVEDRSPLPNLYAGIKDISVYDPVYVPDYPVDKATVIRAVALAPDGSFSDESTGVYFVGRKLRDRYSGSYLLSLTADPEDLFSKESGIYVNGKIWDLHKDKSEIIEKMKYNIDGFEPVFLPVNYNKRGKGWSRYADITLFDDQGRCMESIPGRIKIHGNYSRLETQKSFTLFPLSSGKLFERLPFSGDTVMIRKGGSDDSGLKDDLCSKLTEKLDLAPCDHLPCNLFINGEYWGCYCLTERIDESYIADRYGIDPDNIVLAKNWEVLSENESDAAMFEALKSLVRSIDPADPKTYEQLCDNMDIGNAVDYYCTELYLNNMDFIWNNIALWRVRQKGSGEYEDGKWRFLLYDLDDTCSSPEDDTFDELLTSDNPQFFSYLLRNKDFRNRFRTRFLELEDRIFSYTAAAPVIDRLEKDYTDDMVSSNRRFLSADYSSSDYQAQIDGIRDFFRERASFINEYLSTYCSEPF